MHKNYSLHKKVLTDCLLLGSFYKTIKREEKENHYEENLLKIIIIITF